MVANVAVAQFGIAVAIKKFKNKIENKVFTSIMRLSDILIICSSLIIQIIAGINSIKVIAKFPTNTEL